MQVFPIRTRHTRPFATLLFVTLAVSGCKKKQQYAAYSCGNIQINVHPRGVDHKAVYLCAKTLTNNYTITWVRGSNVKSFQVVFVGPDLPFGPQTTFATSGPPVTTPPLSDPGDLTVFKYNITIVDDNGASYQSDPHVVGGGGIPIQLSTDLQ